MAPGEGTRRAARRWLEYLEVADVPRVRSMFTHHPDYSDLTPVQYADGFAWLLSRGLITSDGHSLIKTDVREQHDSEAALDGAPVQWNPAAEAARRETGTAGERAVIRLLELSGAARVVHVAAVSDAYGYDVHTELGNGGAGHIEVKATTDPTRLVVHLTRHEYEVMRADPDWLLAAVLVGADGDALNVVTVSRDWLTTAAPEDRNRRAQWESARLSVPDHAVMPGILDASGRRLVSKAIAPYLPVWGLPRAPSALPA
ncbi:protein NO VEIN domain-containing protein [Streptomyces sp. NPDC001091]